MAVHAGLRFRLAPRFHSDRAWHDRLRLIGERSGDAGHGDWRPPTTAELEELIAGPEADPECWQRDVCLFRIPDHLRRKWWDGAAAELVGPNQERPHYESFVREVAAFAHFKRVPLPSACSFDVVIVLPDQPMVWEEPSQIAAVINLGEENTSVVLPDGSTPLPEDALARPLQVILEPGDGCWLPPGRRALAGCGSGTSDFDVLLVIRDQESDRLLETGQNVAP